jgi:hypothetical protein
MGIDIIFIESAMSFEDLTKRQIVELQQSVRKELSKAKYEWIIDAWGVKMGEDESEYVSLDLELNSTDWRSSSLYVIPHLLIIMREADKLGIKMEENGLVYSTDSMIGYIRLKQRNFRGQKTFIIEVTEIPKNIDGDNNGIVKCEIHTSCVDGVTSMEAFLNKCEWFRYEKHSPILY